MAGWDGAAWAKFHAAVTVAWGLLIIPTLIWWRESVLWVALMSIWANMATHWGAYQASRAEREADNRQEEPPHERS